MIEVYTDGSCIHNANVSGSAIGPGGFAAAFYKNNDSEPFHIITGGHESTTNNRMEIAAFLEALNYSKQTGIKINNIYSDSQYVINSWNTWLNGWAQKHFRGIKNPDLWEHIYTLKKEMPYIKAIWVKGHSGHDKNEHVNELAQQEAYSFKK